MGGYGGAVGSQLYTCSPIKLWTTSSICNLFPKSTVKPCFAILLFHYFRACHLEMGGSRGSHKTKGFQYPCHHQGETWRSSVLGQCSFCRSSFLANEKFSSWFLYWFWRQNKHKQWQTKVTLTSVLPTHSAWIRIILGRWIRIRRFGSLWWGTGPKSTVYPNQKENSDPDSYER